MGNGTKIGMVLVLVLVVIVTVKVFDSGEPEQQAKSNSKETSSKSEPKAADTASKSAKTTSGTSRGSRAAVSSRSNPRASSPVGENSRTNRTDRPIVGSRPRSGDAANSTRYDAGRDRRLAQNNSTSSNRGASGVANRPESAKQGDGKVSTDPRVRPTSTSASRGGKPVGAIDPSGVRPSPTGAGDARPVPATARSGVASTSETATTSRGNERRRSGIIGRQPGAEPPTTTSERKSSTSTPGFPKTHQVVEGDSLWKLAETYYQRPSLFTLILQHNPKLGDGSELRIGDQLKIPAPPAAVASAVKKNASSKPTTASSSRRETTAQNGFRTHVIEDGDTLYDLAEEYLGSGQRWTDIQKANPGLDPSRLTIGKQIRVPNS